ncbi:LCP family protein [Peribacillus cavernae]|nr:LCP family protein [Peribacillus cavernae]MDQ0217939.1 LCP family protein required for cell wall assembly [Peribacillus cavernae]
MRQRVLALLCLMLLLSGCMGVPHDSKTNPLDSAAKQNQKNHATESAHDDVTSSSETFLLTGVDSRGEPSSRSDAILLAQYDPHLQKVKLASIMRDSYVKIPGYKLGSNKINTAYYLGGSELLKKTIYHNFHIKVDHVVTIDFKGFEKLVDLLAPEGIKVDVKPEMIQDMSIEASKGENILHGEEILKYVRFRHDGESDFGRVQRQQEVLIQLKDNMTERFSSVEGIVSMPHLLNEAMALTDSDMKMKDYLEYGSSLLFNPIEEVNTLRIPVEGSFTDQIYPHSGSVLLLDMKRNQTELKDFFEK